jgi:hypothetical protein
MDVHDAWVRGKSISEIARATGRDRKTIRGLLREGAQAARKPRQISSKLDPFREYLLARMVGEDPVSNAGSVRRDSGARLPGWPQHSQRFHASVPWPGQGAGDRTQPFGVQLDQVPTD